MELATEISARIAGATSLELLPAYLLPADAAARGWADVDGHLGLCARQVARAYAELCAADADARTPEASLLALVATTENLRAVNARKRLCVAGAIAPAAELHVLDVLLASHLYKHAKSPMLWSHRRWLVETFALAPGVEREWAVVRAAAEHHARNYYAWAYMRWWCTHTDVWRRGADLRTLVALTADLCKQHLSDVSMWTFAAWLGAPELEELARRTDAAMPGHAAILASVTVRPHSPPSSA